VSKSRIDGGDRSGSVNPTGRTFSEFFAASTDFTLEVIVFSAAETVIEIKKQLAITVKTKRNQRID